MREILKRMKSPVFWTEMLLILTMFFRTIGLYDMPNSLLTTIQNIITIIFTMFASLNNPADKNNF